jgi:hypothetical protein
MLTMAMAILGGIFFSQAPEFSQQYRQRIGGALDELRAVITRFDSEATRNGLDREDALGLYSGSPQPFLRSQGSSMRSSFSRYETLEQQSREIAQASPLAKPFVILRNPDPDIITSAWSDFSPGIPVTTAGLAWAGIGVVAGWLAAALFGTVSLRATRSRRRSGSAEPDSGGDRRRKVLRNKEIPEHPSEGAYEEEPQRVLPAPPPPGTHFPLQHYKDRQRTI